MSAPPLKLMARGAMFTNALAGATTLAAMFVVSVAHTRPAPGYEMWEMKRVGDWNEVSSLGVARWQHVDRIRPTSCTGSVTASLTKEGDAHW